MAVARHSANMTTGSVDHFYGLRWRELASLNTLYCVVGLVHMDTSSIHMTPMHV
jgi:hypothetical protein